MTRNDERSSRAVLYLAFGSEYVSESLRSLDTLIDVSAESYVSYLVTDESQSVPNRPDLKVVRHRFELEGLLRKAELVDFIPEGHNSYLLLDSDTVVLGDISFGFRAAELHGLAIAPAPHYSLDHFWGFDKTMTLEGVPLAGQLQYNTGVMFFQLTPKVRTLFRAWKELAVRHSSRPLKNDQPFLSLAMEKHAFNPYTLSRGYNYRGFGEIISGDIRIWHSRDPLPPSLNDFASSWPPRRALAGKVIEPGIDANSHTLERTEKPPSSLRRAWRKCRGLLRTIIPIDC